MLRSKMGSRFCGFDIIKTLKRALSYNISFISGWFAELWQLYYLAASFKFVPSIICQSSCSYHLPLLMLVAKATAGDDVQQT